MTLYKYENNFKLGNNNFYCIFGVKENKYTSIFEKFSYILEWFSIGFLFYLNSTYIHSKLFALFIFIMGICLLFTLNFEKKITTKEDLLKKVNEILEIEQ